MHAIIEEYKLRINDFASFKKKVEDLIKELLIQNNIHFHRVESRVKEIDKLEEKIARKEGKYSALSEVTDIVGIRIITFFEDEVDKAAKIIEKEFVNDVTNSIDKRVLEADRFGYKCLHYVVSLLNEREKLTEYRRFGGIKIEVQIRSILQHAWAEIEHDLGYKGKYSVPDSLKRSFYRVAALLEIADMEFVKIKNEVKDYEKGLTEKVNSSPENIGIDASSFKAYVYTDLVSSIEMKIAERTDKILKDPNAHWIEFIIEKLYFIDIRTIKDLNSLLDRHSRKVVEFASDWLGSVAGKQQSIYRGISIFYLAYIVVMDRKDQLFMQAYLKKFFAEDPTLANRLLEAYEQFGAL